jgi:integrase/recombinase XerD
MNRRVSVWKYVRVGKKWRYCKPAVGRNGKIKPDWVIVRGKEEHHPEGNFYLHRYEGTREIWKRIGPSAQEALNAADFESTYLTARAKGIPVKQIDTPVLSIKAAAHGWLEDVKLSNRPETYELYEHTLRQFQEWNLNGGPHRINVVDLTRRDLLEYRKWLLDDEKNSTRTAENKLTRLSQWYRDSLKLKPGEGIITTKDTRIGVTDREPEIYTTEELRKFFNACVQRWPAEQLLFRTFLVTGFREDEIRFLTWADLDWKNFTIKVTPKPEYDFVIKDHEERTVPVPPWDLGSLKVKKEFWEQTYKRKHRLVFATKNGNPDNHMLEKLKKIWREAGLNCGICPTCIEKNECERAYLHKFRSTYGTMMLRKYDISTVRKLMGHKPGSEATFRYLAPMLHEELRKKGVDVVFEKFVDWDYGQADDK